MIPPLPQGLIEYRHVMRFGDRLTSNVWHFLPLVPVETENALQVLNDAMRFYWAFGGPVTGIGPASFQSASGSLFSQVAELVRIGPPPLRLIEAIAAVSVPGEGTGPPAALNSAVCVRLHTVGPFRRGDGRFYFPGLATDFLEHSDGTTVAAPVRSDIVDAFNDMQGAIDDYTGGPRVFQWVVWNRSRQVGGPFAMPAVSTVERVSVPQANLCSMVRRLPNHRPHAPVACPSSAELH